MIMANPEYANGITIDPSHLILTLSTRFPKIRACLFDMDGLLIDTEDIYTACNNVILHEYGKPSLPWKIKAQLQGRPGPEVNIPPFPSYISSPGSIEPPKPSADPVITGQRDLSRLGSTPHPALDIHNQTSRATSPVLPHNPTSPRRPIATQKSGTRKHSSRTRYFLARKKFQAENHAPKTALLCLSDEPKSPGRRSTHS